MRRKKFSARKKIIHSHIKPGQTQTQRQKTLQDIRAPIKSTTRPDLKEKKTMGDLYFLEDQTKKLKVLVNWKNTKKNVQNEIKDRSQQLINDLNLTEKLMVPDVKYKQTILGTVSDDMWVFTKNNHELLRITKDY